MPKFRLSTLIVVTLCAAVLLYYVMQERRARHADGYFAACLAVAALAFIGYFIEWVHAWRDDRKRETDNLPR
jgi:hypothetical protein